MTTKFQEKGEVKDWTNNTGSPVVSGQIVRMSHLLGVAITDIPVGEVGAVKVGGVFAQVPKVTAAVFAVGEKLLWDQSAGKFDDSLATPASDDLLGAAIAWEAGTNGQTVCTVKLTPNNAQIGPSA